MEFSVVIAAIRIVVYEDHTDENMIWFETSKKPDEYLLINFGTSTACRS